MKISRQILEKYNKAVPRYTSYPPATSFRNYRDEKKYVEVISTSNNEVPNNISLYFHIPFCPKLCWFCGCSTSVNTSQNSINEYISGIVTELKNVSGLLNPARKVSQIHWGGGTPNAISLDFIQKVMDKIYNHFQFISNPEIAIECNPAYLSFSDIDQLCSFGFNRFSLGIQDFRQDVLKAVNRDSCKIPVKELVDYIRKQHQATVNLDFIYGLPLQTVNSFLTSIEQAVEIAPDRLVTFSYAHVPWIKKNQKKLEKTGFPGSEDKIKMLEKSYNLLTDSGYVSIGLDHYAQPEDELAVALKKHKLHRNFQGYCTRETTGQVYAFGATAITQLGNAYVQNERKAQDYLHKIDENGFAPIRGHILNKEEKIIRAVINEVMCNKFLSWKKISAELAVDVDQIKEITQFKNSHLKELQQDGLVDFNENELKVTDLGHFFIRNIAAAFDPQFKNSKNKFSKTI